MSLEAPTTGPGRAWREFCIRHHQSLLAPQPVFTNSHDAFMAGYAAGAADVGIALPEVVRELGHAGLKLWTQLEAEKIVRGQK